MRDTSHIEAYRITKHQQPQFNSDASFGMNGCFQIPYAGDDRIQFMVIVSDGTQSNEFETHKLPWEHVSARARFRSRNGSGKTYERVPTWKEMCWLKELFWNDDEVVVQFHPRKEDYVNIHPNVLHLWRWTGGDFPTPPKICV